MTVANFFQPSDAKTSETSTSTPSAAAQAMAKFRADILGKLLQYGSSRGPTFKQFTHGADLRAPLPGGLNSGIGALLAAMSEPGAFTSSRTSTGTLQPPAGSQFSDLAQLGLLGAQLYQSGILGAGADAIGKILNYIGGAEGIGGVNPALGDSAPNPDDSSNAQDLALAQYFFNADPTSGGANSYGVNMSDQGSGADVDPYIMNLLSFL